VLVGSGGILAEVVGDVSIRPVPLTDQDIDEMLRELRGYPLLTGTRGRPPADVAGLRALIAKVAVLAERCGPALSELDLNPVIVGASAVEVVDALVVAS
jgi:acyl-CoA synthetase (NDP forming)